LTPLEVIAVVMAVGYLLLAIRENIWCWFCAGVSTAIYVWLFLAARLYMESALNVFYFGMAIYGWYVWTSGRSDGHERPVAVWPAKTHAIAIALIVGVSLGSGYLLSTRTNAAFPYVDSLTTWSAIWATFLVARKVLENWWYWLVIDTASIFIYWSRDLELTSLLFVLYVIMIPFGIVSWTRSYREAAQWT
jgi:nicotinamide mononucleotide transporter